MKLSSADNLSNNTLHYSCKLDDKIKKRINRDRKNKRSIGNYIEDLSYYNPKDKFEKLENLNKMLDAKFRPYKLKKHVYKTIATMK